MKLLVRFKDIILLVLIQCICHISARFFFMFSELKIILEGKMLHQMTGIMQVLNVIPKAEYDMCFNRWQKQCKFRLF